MPRKGLLLFKGIGAGLSVYIKEMKRVPLQRKTPIRSYQRIHPKNASTGRIRGLARVSKTPVAKLKRELWEITRQIIFKLHGDTCYTCGAKNLKKQNLQCGHFLPSSVCSTELRYDLTNLKPQCGMCNVWRSGNWPAYWQHLTDDGVDIEALKRRNEQTKGMKYGPDWYVAKIAEYKAHYETIRGVDTKEVMGSK